MKIDNEVIEKVCNKFFGGIAEKNFKILFTRGGNLSIIISHHAGGNKPLLGAYYTANDESGEWLPATWFESGHYHPVHQTKLDLIMPQEKEVA